MSVATMNFQIIFSAYMGYKLIVKSKWLNTGQVPFWHVFRPSRSRDPSTRKKQTKTNKERVQYPAM